jgi:ubiquitin carboxyl-terminal hydrolase 36/42
MVCHRCKKPVNAEKQFTVHEAPIVLTVHFKRFSPLGRKLAHPIHYDERLSLQPVMSEGQYGPTYSLYGVICHAGSGPNSGHYYGYVKSAAGQWYEMNDESVSHTRTPVGLKSAYMLFYIRDKGQALEEAVSRVSIPQRNNVAAGMKKRKVANSDDEKDQEDTGVKMARPFIGPQLPSPAPSSVGTSPNPNTVDPQAEIVKKKIAAASSKVKAVQALRDLSLYVDDDDEESSKEGGASDRLEASISSTQAIPSTSEHSASPPATPSSIPADNFYRSSSGKGKKRKSPPPDEDAYQNNQSRSKPLYNSPGLTSSSPRFKHRKKPTFGGNPFNRVRGSNNLHSKDSASYRPSPVTYKRKRTFAI